jgi:hypothetical protein
MPLPPTAMKDGMGGLSCRPDRMERLDFLGGKKMAEAA